MFSTSKDEIDEVYDSLRAYFKIDDDWDINKYLVIDLDRLPNGSIYII